MITYLRIIKPTLSYNGSICGNVKYYLETISKLKTYQHILDINDYANNRCQNGGNYTDEVKNLNCKCVNGYATLH